MDPAARKTNNLLTKEVVRDVQDKEMGLVQREGVRETPLRCSCCIQVSIECWHVCTEQSHQRRGKRFYNQLEKIIYRCRFKSWLKAG